jgi:outer membrane protein TolC
VDAEGLALSDVVALALARNPSLRAVEERRNEVAGGVREARSEAFPQLAVTSSWSLSRNPSLLNSPDFEEFIGNFPGGSFVPGEQELYGVGVELSQPLFTWGKIPAALDLARLVVDVTDAQIRTAQLDAGLRAATAYYELLAARASLTIIRAQEEARRAALAVVEARYELGDATRLELLQAQAVLAELPPSIHQAEGRAEIALIDLRTLLVLDADPALVEESPGHGLDDAPAAELALGMARKHRPELADLELQREALGRQQTVTRADGKPQVELNGAYGRTVRLLENLDDALFADWAVAVGLRWDFFDGGRRRGLVEQLESRREQLRWQLENLVDQVELQIEQALANYRTARSRFVAAEISARAAVEASRVARESYQEGLALQADWLTAQEREIQAEVLRVQSYYDARVAGSQLARVMGLLPHQPWAGPVSSEGGGPEPADVQTSEKESVR